MSEPSEFSPEGRFKAMMRTAFDELMERTRPERDKFRMGSSPAQIKAPSSNRKPTMQTPEELATAFVANDDVQLYLTEQDAISLEILIGSMIYRDRIEQAAIHCLKVSKLQAECLKRSQFADRGVLTLTYAGSDKMCAAELGAAVKAIRDVGTVSPEIARMAREEVG